MRHDGEARHCLGDALCEPVTFAEQTIPASEATKHVGEKAAVCGVVARARYASRSKGQPTLLNLDKPHPNAVSLPSFGGG